MVITGVIYSLRFMKMLFEIGLEALMDRWVSELAFFCSIIILLFLGLLIAIYIDQKMGVRK